ncbi:Uncharacterised protein [Streptococcus pneumoniae]|nr:Uncharacterised protein [Streptococcus pneumoniae]
MKMLVKYLILCYSESMDFFSRMILDILIAITCSFTYSIEIKEQTRKLAIDSSKHWFEEIFKEYKKFSY